MFTQLKWMTLSERVVYHKAMQMYKTVCRDASDYLKNDFAFTSEIHSRLLRSSSNFQLYTPKRNTELFELIHFFRHFHFGILFLNTLKLHLLWNVLNLCIKDGINDRLNASSAFMILCSVCHFHHVHVHIIS